MNSAITDDSTSRAERAFRMHLSLFTNPAMTAEAYANLLIEDVVQEYPFAPAPFPNRVAGREAVTAYLVNVTQLATNWSFTDFTFSTPSDPDILFVELKGGAFVTATGKMYQQVYIGRIQVRGEQIAHHREYWNPAWILDAFDTGSTAEKTDSARGAVAAAAAPPGAGVNHRGGRCSGAGAPDRS